MNHIILIGFMGCGKTSVGIRLSYKYKMTFVDTDREIEQKSGCKISELFDQYGEEHFRNLETECLRNLLTVETPQIISVGGGLPLRKENRKLLGQLGTVVYLSARAETIWRRLKNDKTRPLLMTPHPKQRIKELLSKREEIYREAADFVVAVDHRSFDQILNTLDKKLGRKKPMKKLLVINGPNINFLGIREKEVYGAQDYDYLLNLIAGKGKAEHLEIEVFQSNHEGAIIDRIQDAYFDKTEGIVINPGAYTHYSYAIRDALSSISVPKVEIHISDITKREEFRKVSVTAPACDHQIYGKGLDGYLEAIDFVIAENAGQIKE